MLHAETPAWLVLRQSHLETMLTTLSSIPALPVVSDLPQRLKLPELIYFVLQILSWAAALRTRVRTALSVHQRALSLLFWMEDLI